MAETVEEARRIVAELENKLAAAEARAVELQTERRRLSFDANTGDGAAEKGLKALNTEAAHINLDIENIRSAIDEAKRRLAAAERDEAMAAARDNAEAALVIGNRLVERAAKIDAALATAREEMLAYKRDVDALHLTGCAAPTAQQFLTFGGLAVTAFTMQLPVKVDRDFLAPRERRTFTELTSAWRDGVTNWAARVPRQMGGGVNETHHKKAEDH